MSEQYDLVSRKSLIDRFDGRRVLSGAKNPKVAVDVIINEINRAPTIEPPAVRGRWKNETVGANFYCSQCGYETSDDEAHNFCPNCGADMRCAND
jgi:rubrerythrin